MQNYFVKQSVKVVIETTLGNFYNSKIRPANVSQIYKAYLKHWMAASLLQC